jgi:hypothetical protein
MQTMFDALMEQLKVPLRGDRGIKTDNSILLIYEPPKELEFRDYLLDKFIPVLEAGGIPFRAVDLSGLLLSALSEDELEGLQEDEFGDYRWMQQGLSQRAEAALHACLQKAASEVPGGTVLVYGTMALYPLVRFGEILKDFRDLEVRIALAFPGQDRGGKLHFMNQPDGGNYLAVKLNCQSQS